MVGGKKARRLTIIFVTSTAGVVLCVVIVVFLAAAGYICLDNMIVIRIRFRNKVLSKILNN